MAPETTIASKNPLFSKSWDGLFYILGSVALCFIISMATFNYHTSMVNDGPGYDKNKLSALQLHKDIIRFLMVLWPFTFYTMFFLPPLALLNKRKVSWKSLLFCVVSQVSVFFYFKFSDFPNWYMD